VDSTKDAKRLKSELRKRYRAEREFLVVECNWEHLIQSSEVAQAKVVATYISYGLEPDTSALNSALLKAGKTIVIPRMLADKDLEWVRWTGDDADGAVFTDEIDVVIAPALHIDRQGNRLGQGGGSYDRALARTRAWKVALVYPGELSSEQIPSEPHDQKVDAAATAEILVRFTERS
jgi:5-formyltetrahydrofolate cyclo-ligase